jgi:hypothetical protein
MNEDIFGAVLGLNKAETLLKVKPFNGTNGHDFLHESIRRRDMTMAGLSRSWDGTFHRTNARYTRTSQCGLTGLI